MVNRRDFIKNAAVVGGVAALGVPFTNERMALAKESAGGGVSVAVTASGQHKLPPLPYAYEALEPYIDAKTMELHHDKHHQGYLNGLNAAELALKAAQDSGDFGKIADLERALAFHGSGHANHSLFWNNMKPKSQAKPKPEGALLNWIDRDFGSLEKFKEQFSAAAKTVEGSGWGMLVYQPLLGRLYTVGVLNHQNSLVAGAIPLLVLDVWEHAYYLKYQNKRADYVAAWWNVVDWADVERNFQAARQG
ncbi:MAG: twin-arginine translocation signal domain-containing protein [Myxococcales bacterium]|nr:MAG: twin-arginine translocation signal domain-containing protein [Myxococcales bacterium]